MWRSWRQLPPMMNWRNCMDSTSRPLWGMSTQVGWIDTQECFPRLHSRGWFHCGLGLWFSPITLVSLRIISRNLHIHVYIIYQAVPFLWCSHCGVIGFIEKFTPKSSSIMLFAKQNRLLWNRPSHLQSKRMPTLWVVSCSQWEHSKCCFLKWGKNHSWSWLLVDGRYLCTSRTNIQLDCSHGATPM